MKLEVEGTPQVTTTTPSAGIPSNEQQVVNVIREEIDGYHAQLRQLTTLPPEEVFAIISSITARLAELRTRLWRSDSRRYAALRTREVEPLLEICDKLFRIHSRSVAIAQMEWNETRGLT